MIEELLRQEEGKTLEFKENSCSLDRIMQTVVAFANTAGGRILLGVKDRTKELVGVQDVLEEELRLSNAIAASVVPLLCPDIHVLSWQGKQFLLLVVPHSASHPHYIKSKGAIQGTYVRLGSTNRIADDSMRDELQRSAARTSFDELPMANCSVDDIDMEAARAFFVGVKKNLTESSMQSLKLLTRLQHHLVPTHGAILLFGRNRSAFFPDAMIRCARFYGTTREEVIDQQDSVQYLPDIVNTVLSFVRRHTKMRYVIDSPQRKEVPEYPQTVVREAVINALVHADYSIRGSSIQIAIFDDRLEIMSPGALPIGISMEDALSGVSHLRNRVIGRVFQELLLIEHWGLGLSRMIGQCRKANLPDPRFEEVGNFFRVTLYSGKASLKPLWEESLLEYLRVHGRVSIKETLEIWHVSHPTARQRLAKLVRDGILSQISSHPRDPAKVYILKDSSR